MPEVDAVAQIAPAVSQSLWAVYFCLLVTPFIQEDAAVMGAASLSLNGVGDTGIIFMFMVVGLMSADFSKYTTGRLARTSTWAKKFAEKPAVAKAEKLINDKMAPTLLSARFIPGMRMPMFIGAGYFRTPPITFLALMLVSATLYIGAIFVLFHAVGAVAGESAKKWLPVISIGGIVAFLTVRYAMRKLAARPSNVG